MQMAAHLQPGPVYRRRCSDVLAREVMLGVFYFITKFTDNKRVWSWGALHVTCFYMLM